MNTIQLKNKSNCMCCQNFLYKLKINKKFFIISIILQLTAVPLFYISQIIDSINLDDTVFNSEFYDIISFISLICATFIGVVIAFNNFSYLYKKSEVDMIYSLPINTKQRFLSDFFSGLLIYLVPYLFSSIFSFIINNTGHLISKNWDKDYSFLSNFSLIHYYIYGLLIMIMLYTITVFTLSCCGSIFEGVIYNIIVNVSIPLIPTAIILIFFDKVYGLNLESLMISNVIYSSPIGGLISLLRHSTLSDYFFSSTHYNFSHFFLLWVTLYLINIIIYFVLTYYIYKKRKSEDVGNPFTLKLFYHINLYIILISIISLFLKSKYIIPAIILSAIIFIIFETITKRGFKTFLVPLVRYVSIFAISVVLVLTGNAANGFGLERYIPSVNNIKLLSLSSDQIAPLNTYNYEDYTPLIITDKKYIQLITQANQKMIDKKAKLSFEEYSMYQYFNYFTIDYYFNFGLNLSKSYSIDNEINYMLSELSLSDEYAEMLIKNLHSSLNPKNNDLERTKYMSMNFSTMSISSKLGSTSHSEKFNPTKEFKEKLCNAYKKDWLEQDLEQLLKPDDTLLIINDLFPVFSHFNNTINLLAENKYLHEDSLLSTSITQLKNNFNNKNDYSSNIYIHPPSHYQFSNNTKYIFTQKPVNLDIYTLLEWTKEMDEIIKKVQPYYFTNEDCYTITINGRLYAIPSEYTSKVEKIFNEYCSMDTNAFNGYKTEIVRYSKTSLYEHYRDKYNSYDSFVEAILKNQITDIKQYIN